MHGRGRGGAGRGNFGRHARESGAGATAGRVGTEQKLSDSSTVLRTLLDGSRSHPFKTPLQMRRFVGAALNHCKMYPNDVALVLQCLGSPESAGRQRLAEICRFPHSVNAGTSREACSFQRVTCALLHLITLPVMINSILTQCYNPILATVADNLDFKILSCSAERLAGQGNIADPNYSAFYQEQDGDVWQPANWVQLMQPIVNFLNQVMQRFGCNTEEQLSEVYTSVLSLQETAQKFRQLEHCSGDRIVISDLNNLARLLASKQAEQQNVLTKEARSKQMKLQQQRQQHATKRFQASQDGPGDLRPDGQRHDNDYASIADITIAPTQQEVLCQVAPYLPANLPGTVIHLESDSQEAHRDLHFRLLRHDMVAELCESAIISTSRRHSLCSSQRGIIGLCCSAWSR